MVKRINALIPEEMHKALRVKLAEDGAELLRLATREDHRVRRREETEGEEGEGIREMRKAAILFITLLVGLPTLSHAQSAKDALMGLKKIQARTQARSYNDYSNAVGEAKIRLNLYLESYEAQKYPELNLVK